MKLNITFESKAERKDSDDISLKNWTIVSIGKTVNISGPYGNTGAIMTMDELLLITDIISAYAELTKE